MGVIKGSYEIRNTFQIIKIFFSPEKKTDQHRSERTQIKDECSWILLKNQEFRVNDKYKRPLRVSNRIYLFIYYSCYYNIIILL